MNDQHIKALEYELGYSDVGDATKAAIQAAIALMRAAEPKDEAAERKHCYLLSTHETSADEWRIERAAARAEGYASRDAEVAELTRQRGEAWDSSEERLRKLLLAQDEIEELKRRATAWMDAHALQQPEFGQYVQSVEAKLAQLRKEVSRIVSGAVFAGIPQTRQALLEALEASK